jgi:hypothetical protein
VVRFDVKILVLKANNVGDPEDIQLTGLSAGMSKLLRTYLNKCMLVLMRIENRGTFRSPASSPCLTTSKWTKGAFSFCYNAIECHIVS